MNSGDLILGIRHGRHRAIARAISLVENGDRSARRIMKDVFARRGEAVVLGITGAPGSGKSTLVDHLIRRLRASGKKIGVLAVDPTSPFTGGALLGDRVRMMRHGADRGVFIRSLATRGRLGGLAGATGAAVAICETAGMDFVIIETAGVGQDEVEIVTLADVVAVVLTPGWGDDIQVSKAGILEIADVLVINKTDLPGAERLARQLESTIGSEIAGRPVPPIVRTAATLGRGLDSLAAEVLRVLEARPAAEKEARKRRFLGSMLRDITRQKILELVEKRLPSSEFGRCVDEIYGGKADPYGAAESLLAAWKGDGAGRIRSK